MDYAQLLREGTLDDPSGHQLMIDPDRRRNDPNRVDIERGVDRYVFEKRKDGTWRHIGSATYGNFRYLRDEVQVPPAIGRQLTAMAATYHTRFPKKTDGQGRSKGRTASRAARRAGRR